MCLPCQQHFCQKDSMAHFQGNELKLLTDKACQEECNEDFLLKYKKRQIIIKIISEMWAIKIKSTNRINYITISYTITHICM